MILPVLTANLRRVGMPITVQVHSPWEKQAVRLVGEGDGLMQEMLIDLVCEINGGEEMLVRAESEIDVGVGKGLEVNLLVIGDWIE